MIFVYIITAVLAIISIIVQGHLGIKGVKPDLFLVTVVYMSYSFGSFYGETVGFIGGLLIDADSSAPLGLFTFPYVVIAFIVGLFGRSVFKSNLITVVLLLFISSIVKGILTLFLCYIFDQSKFTHSFSVIMTEAAYNALVAPLFFFLMDIIFRRELEQEGYY